MYITSNICLFLCTVYALMIKISRLGFDFYEHFPQAVEDQKSWGEEYMLKYKTLRSLFQVKSLSFPNLIMLREAAALVW